MSLNANELFSEASVAALLRVSVGRIQPKNFASGSGTLAKLTPVAKNKATGFYKKWTSPVSEVTTISSTGTISGGNFTITVNGETTGNIAHDATAATVKTALLALGGIDPEDVVVTGGPLSTNTSLVLTWGGKLAKQVVAVSASLGSLTGGGSATLTETTAGVGDLESGDYDIAGFVWPDPVTLDSDEEVIGNVLMSGTIHFDDIPIVSGYTSNQLKEALRNGGVRQLGFMIQGLSGF